MGLPMLSLKRGVFSKRHSYSLQVFFSFGRACDDRLAGLGQLETHIHPEVVQWSSGIVKRLLSSAGRADQSWEQDEVLG